MFAGPGGWRPGLRGRSISRERHNQADGDPGDRGPGARAFTERGRSTQQDGRGVHGCAWMSLGHSWGRPGAPSPLGGVLTHCLWDVEAAGKYEALKIGNATGKSNKGCVKK